MASSSASGRKILLMAGSSGVGKGTIKSHILTKYSNHFLESVSATTRSPRKGEVDGVHYHYRTTKDFERFIEQKKLLEYVKFDGNYYGTLRSEIDSIFAKGKVGLANSDSFTRT